jgi:hypothetical protein
MFHGAPGHHHSLSFQTGMHFASAVHTEIVSMNLPDFGQHFAVAHRTCRFGPLVSGDESHNQHCGRGGHLPRAGDDLRREERPYVAQNTLS